jgi:hypothetical protein
MKNIFNKKQFSNIFILVLIVLFSCLIVYQLYLAINNKRGKNYSKLIEGFNMSNITPQGPIECNSSTTLPSNFYNVIMTDISNIEILNNNINGIANQVDGMIKNSNNVNNTTIADVSLNVISSSPTITSSSNALYFCNAVNTNYTNITTMNENIQSIFTSVEQLPSYQSENNPPVFQPLTATNSISCGNAETVPISTVCQTENTNINNINVVHANTISLNNVVNNLQTTQNNQLKNQNQSAMTISNSVGINN